MLAVEPDVYASANPGCLLQVTAALRRAGRPVTAAHPIELLDASIRGTRELPPRRRREPARRRCPAGPRLPLMSELPLTGGCLCGAVRFEIDAPLVNASWCHCTRCQRRTGTPASAQAPRRARLVPRSLQGEEALRACEPAAAAAPKVFCGECGSALWSQSPDDPGIKAVRLGAFDGDPGDPAELPPVRRLRRGLGSDPGRRPAAVSRAQARVARRARVSG